MAKLSNINGRFAVEDDGAIQFNGQAGTSGYVLESRGASSPPVWTDRDTGNVTGSGAANRVTYWSSATNVTSDAGFTYNGAGRVNTDESFGVSKDGADAVADGPFFRLTNAVQDRQYLWQLDASNNIDYWYYNGSTWAQTISLLNDGGATFGGTVTAPRIGIPGANSSFALYNDSNSYFNGAVTVDSTFTQTGGAASSFSGDVTANGNVTIANTSPDLYLFPTGSFHSFRVSAQENVANTFEITPSTTAGGSTYSNPALSISHTGNSTFAGNVEFDKNVWQDISTNGGYIMRPNGADYVTTTGTVTGAIEIRIPTGGAGKDDMIKFVVDIYDYATQESITVFIGGYIYQAVGGNTWINVSAQIIATDSSKNYTVRFGDNGSVHCVWIGETDSTWSYPQILVRDFYGGFATNVEDYLATWDITYVTSITTVNNTLTNNFPMSHGGTDDAFWSANGNNIYNDNSGNVGIGTTSPSAKLEVNGALFVGNHTGTVTPTSGIFIEEAAGNDTQIQMYTYGGSVFRILGSEIKADIGWASSQNRSVNFNNTGTGNISVGIGTTSPNALLNLSQAAGANIRFDNETTTNYFTIGEGVGTNNVFSFRGNSYRSTDTMSIDFVNDRVGIGTITPGATLDVVNGGNYESIRIGNSQLANVNKQGGITALNYIGNSTSIFQYATNAGANVVYYGSADGSFRGLTQHSFMVSSGPDTVSHAQPLKLTAAKVTMSADVTMSGSVGIGETTLQRKFNLYDGTDTWTRVRCGASTADWLLGIAGSDHTYKWYNQSSNGGAGMKMTLATSGTLTVSADLVAYGSPSDKRLKENIKPIESALDKVVKLQGVTFDWKEKSITNLKEDIGFIAQDVQKVIPELVRENQNGMLSMRHQGIAPILLEAIKELKAEIEELKKCKCDCKK